MATTNIQSFAGDVEVAGELTVTGQLNSTTGSDKVKLTATTASETDYIPLSKGTTGAQPLYTNSDLTYNPANNVIGANLSGNVTGNVTGNVSGNAAFATNATYANSAGSATNATFATNSSHANNANTVAFTDRDGSNNTDYIAFVDSHAAGDKALYTDQNLTYNSSTNHINANVPYATSAGSASCPAFFDATHTANVAANALYNFDLHHVRIPSNMTLNIYFYAPIAGYYYFTFSGLNAYAPYAANVGWEKQGSRYPSTNDSDYIIDYYSAHASRRITSSVIMYLGVGHTASLKRISGTGQGGSNRYTGFFLSY